VIVDSSAIVAILFGEPEAAAFEEAILDAPQANMSAASYFETALVIDGKGDEILTQRLDQIIDELTLEVVPFTPSQAQLARDAYQIFGRGNGHPAKLNFGDCFSYALAVESNDFLLFKGDDFSKTNVKIAAY
jgi:ribonuclease VapC